MFLLFFRFIESKVLVDIYPGVIKDTIHHLIVHMEVNRKITVTGLILSIILE